MESTAARAWPETGGEYRPTGEWSAGHPVFSNGDLYLCVVPGENNRWSVRDSPDSEDVKLRRILTWHPPPPGADRNKLYFQFSWQYSDSVDWLKGDIRVNPDPDHGFRLI